MKFTKSLVYLALWWLISGCAVASQPAPQPEPALSMMEAIQKASAYVESKGALTDHYLDRVWINQVEGLEGLHWIVSWSPDGLEKPTKGWVIVVVNMKGEVLEPKRGVQWRNLKGSKPAKNNSEEATKGGEGSVEKLRDER